MVARRQLTFLTVSYNLFDGILPKDGPAAPCHLYRVICQKLAEGFYRPRKRHRPFGQWATYPLVAAAPRAFDVGHEKMIVAAA
jgi:hypothetical protein